ncbi:MAG: TVP38/TMEM64 family protein [Clostridiales bacterium]|nr:TVP38/TMEM64 family protein [Clostridiales bacterium]
MLKKFIKLILSLIPVFMLIIGLFCNSILYLDTNIKVVISFIIILFSCIYLVYSGKLPLVLRKVIIVIAYVFSFGLILYSLLDHYDMLKYFTSITAIKELILATGGKGVFVFFLIQVAQVVFLPIPAIALIIVGILVFGPIKTMVLCILGVLIGSYIAFMIGKTFGYKFISWIIGQNKVDKCANLLKNNGKYLLSIVFIFPFFPDDLFCMVAGMSSMTFKEFFIIATSIRPITIVVLCLFGGEAFMSSNIYLLIIFIAIIIVGIFLFIKLKKNKRIKALLKN